MPNTKWERLLGEAQSAAKSAREIAEKAEGREFTDSERSQFDEQSNLAHSKKDACDRAKSDADMVTEVLGGIKDPVLQADEIAGKSGFLPLSRGKALAGRIAQNMRPDSKALNPNGDTLTQVSLDDGVVEDGKPATSLFDVIPSKPRNSVYEYLRQTSRDNQAAIVAPGSEKPTSSYAVSSVRGELQVFAHISDAIDHYLLGDNDSLRGFVQSEMVYGLRAAVEDEVVNGAGGTGHLTGMLNVDGAQVQSFGADQVTTLRAAATKLETVGYEASGFILNPNDWESIETSRNASGGFDLNGPVNRAARRVWGVPVALSVTMPEGTAVAFDSSALSIDSDQAIASQWSNATADDFARNQVRMRCESRFNLSVYRPTGIVNVSLSSGSTS
jgi:HK97 family phage major capsid protein